MFNNKYYLIFFSLYDDSLKGFEAFQKEGFGEFTKTPTSKQTDGHYISSAVPGSTRNPEL
jgi:hypothetical protein